MHRLTPFLVVLYISALILGASVISAWGSPGAWSDPCKQPGAEDTWSLEEDPQREGEYIFSYTNSIKRCSEGLERGLEVRAPDGFSVILYVHVGYEEDKEYIYLEPLDPQYQSYPPDLLLEDSSQPAIIRLRPGTS